MVTAIREDKIIRNITIFEIKLLYYLKLPTNNLHSLIFTPLRMNYFTFKTYYFPR